MATVAELAEDIAEVTGERRETVNAYARALIDAGMLPKSRGRAIAQVDVEDIIVLMAAVALEPKIKDVAEVVEAYLNLLPQGVMPSFPEEMKITAGDFLPGFLSDLYIDPQTDADFERMKRVREAEFTFVKNWPEVAVQFEPAGEPRGTARWKEPGTLPGHWNAKIMKSTIVGGMAFAMLGGRRRDYVEELGRRKD